MNEMEGFVQAKIPYIFTCIVRCEKGIYDTEGIKPENWEVDKLHSFNKNQINGGRK